MAARTQHPAVTLPNKQYFKIGEVGRLVGVKPHVLRYWETEFSALRPKKTHSNQRLYTRRDVEQLLLIKRLLYDEGFTIAGAKRRLRELSAAHVATSPEALRSLVADLRRQVQSVLELVE